LISEKKLSNQEQPSLLQKGEGSLHKNFHDNSADFYDHLATKVAEKITAKSSFTNLFQPSEAATSTLVTLATPSTSAPLAFANQIQKDQTYDKFGKH
jgi:hypothetical protein